MMLQVTISEDEAERLAEVTNRFIGQKVIPDDPNEPRNPNSVTRADMSREFTEWAVGAWERGAPFPEKPWAAVMEGRKPSCPDVWFYSGFCRVQLVLEDG